MVPIFVLLMIPQDVTSSKLSRAEPALTVTVSNHFQSNYDVAWWQRANQNGYSILQGVAVRPNEALALKVPEYRDEGLDLRMIYREIAARQQFDEWISSFFNPERIFEKCWFAHCCIGW